MANVGDIKPAQPLWPKRPADKVEPGGRRPDHSSGKQRRPDEEGRGDRDHEDRDDGHIDEYA